VRKGQKTRQRIVETAAALMNRSGWLATPASQVLAGTKLTKGGLYNHFSGLDELAAEAFDFSAGLILKLLKTKLQIEGNARDRLFHLLDAFEMIGARRPPFDAGCPILNAATETDDVDEDFRRRVARVATQIIDELEAVIRAGILAGEFHSALDARRSAQFLFAAFEGGVMLAGIMRDPTVFAQLKSDLRALIDRWTTEGHRHP